MLTEHEIFERILLEIVLVADPESIIDTNNVLALLATIDQLTTRLPTRGVGDLRDYSSEQIAAIESAVRRLRNHAFYELKTNAIASMLHGDSVVAIVLGCAALEGAHGAFMRLELRDKHPGDSGKFNDFMNGLLREVGFYSLVQLSVRVLMNDDERPTDDDLERCLRGVTMRNTIMHSAVKRTGEYKIRELTNSAINAGYSGIMAVYRAFEAAVEIREKS